MKAINIEHRAKKILARTFFEVYPIIESVDIYNECLRCMKQIALEVKKGEQKRIAYNLQKYLSSEEIDEIVKEYE